MTDNCKYQKHISLPETNIQIGTIVLLIKTRKPLEIHIGGHFSRWPQLLCGNIARSLNVGPSFYSHPLFEYVDSKGVVKSVGMCMCTNLLELPANAISTKIVCIVPYFIDFLLN